MPPLLGMNVFPRRCVAHESSAAHTPRSGAQTPQSWMLDGSCWSALLLLASRQSGSPIKGSAPLPSIVTLCVPNRMAAEATGGVTMTSPTNSPTRKAKSSANTSWKGGAHG